MSQRARPRAAGRHSHAKGSHVTCRQANFTDCLVKVGYIGSASPSITFTDYANGTYTASHSG
jgi:hypothetical protein